MDLDKIPLMTAITKKMGWLNSKQRVISQNIANADTPGYRAKELEPQDFKGLLDKAPVGSGARGSSVRMATTQKGHMTAGGGNGAGGGASQMTQPKIRDAESYEASPNGNNVVLEDQMMDMADTQVEYGTMINIYRKQVNILRTALGKSKN